MNAAASLFELPDVGADCSGAEARSREMPSAVAGAVGGPLANPAGACGAVKPDDGREPLVCNQAPNHQSDHGVSLALGMQPYVTWRRS